MGTALSLLLFSHPVRLIGYSKWWTPSCCPGSARVGLISAMHVAAPQSPRDALVVWMFPGEVCIVFIVRLLRVWLASLSLWLTDRPPWYKPGHVGLYVTVCPSPPYNTGTQTVRGL